LLVPFADDVLDRVRTVSHAALESFAAAAGASSKATIGGISERGGQHRLSAV
jgi:hypothetical protein